MEIKIPSKRYEIIKKKIVRMFVEYGISCVPISGFEIAIKMGISVIPYSAFPASERLLLTKKSKDGFSVQLATGECYIYYNDGIDNYGRINNTIMHEIGHIILDHSEDSDLAEAEVKFFAKYALVPPPLVSKLRITSAMKVMETFDVSIEAANNAMNYYKKWLSCGRTLYSDYEVILLKQFDIA